MSPIYEFPWDGEGNTLKIEAPNQKEAEKIVLGLCQAMAKALVDELAPALAQDTPKGRRKPHGRKEQPRDP